MNILILIKKKVLSICLQVISIYSFCSLSFPPGTTVLHFLVETNDFNFFHLSNLSFYDR